MDAVRQRYEGLFQEVHKRVRKRCPALDRLDLHLKPSEAKQWGGQAAFSKSSWPCTYSTWRTGFSIWGVSLDELTAANPPEPDAHIWLAVEKQADKRVGTLRRRLAAKAPRIFKNRRILWRQDEEDDRVCLWYPLPEGTSGLLALLSKDDGESFVDCIAKHVELLAGFVPVLDAVLLKGRSK